MKRSLLITAILVLSGTVALAAENTKEYLVKLRSPIESKASFSFLNKSGVRVESTIPQLNIVKVNLNDTQVKSFNKSLDVEYAVPNYTRHLDMGSNKPGDEANNLWGMKAIHAMDAWKVTKGDKKIILAVSDTGSMSNHQDLKGNFWTNPKEIPGNGIDDDGNGFVDDVRGWNFETNTNNPEDDHYHGTHVSGTIGAVHNGGGVAGVVAEATIMTVKFIGRDGSGTDEAAIKTILYAADNGAKAVNCSWGGSDDSPAIYDSIEYAKSKGMLVIAAAGNSSENTDNNPQYPSAYSNENLISVAATTKEDGSLAGFSNYGVKTVDLAAPGDNIYSTFNPLYSQLHRVWYEYLSGTSMATPHVTGAVGLVYAANPKLNWKQVKEILLGTVRTSGNLSGKVLTGGQLDVAAAVKKAQSM